MSQNDLTIANQGFASFRSDLNSALQALGSTNSGTSAPSTTFANQLFYDTTNNILKIRNEDNDAFISLFTLDQTNDNIEALTISGTLTYTGDLVSSTAGTSNFRAGVNAGNSITSGGNYNVTVGDEAGTALTTGDNNVAVGFEALKTEDANGGNTAVGYRALKVQDGGAEVENTAIGKGAGQSIDLGRENVLVGANVGDALDHADYNTAMGNSALGADVKGHKSTAIGYASLNAQSFSSSTDSHNTAVGYFSGVSVTTGIRNTLIGSEAGDSLTDADDNVAIGALALSGDTQGSRSTAIGRGALKVQNFSSATNSANTAVGYSAGESVTTGQGNTFIGVETGDGTDDGDNNTAVGVTALSANCGDNNTAIGYRAGISSTGSLNTFIGNDSGFDMTSGTKNTFLGRYDGNAGSLDLRTADNYIVFSDGDGNVRQYFTNSGQMFLGSDPGIATDYTSSNVLITNFGSAFGNNHMVMTTGANTSGYNYIVLRNGNGIVGNIGTSGSGSYYLTSSDYRLKENVVDMTGAIDRVKQLSPKRFNFIKDATTTLDGFLAHEAQAVIPESVAGDKDAVDDNGEIDPQGIDQSKLVPLLTGALKEAIAKIEALETRVATLEG